MREEELKIRYLLEMQLFLISKPTFPTVVTAADSNFWHFGAFVCLDSWTQVDGSKQASCCSSLFVCGCSFVFRLVQLRGLPTDKSNIEFV